MAMAQLGGPPTVKPNFPVAEAIPVGQATEGISSIPDADMAALNAKKAKMAADAAARGAAPAAADAAAVAPEAATGLRGTFGSIGRTLVSGAKGLIAGAAPAVVAVGARRGLESIGSNDAPSGPVPAADPTADRSQGAAAIPTAADMGIPDGADARYPAPAAQPGNWLRDTELGRNINNAVNAVGGSLGGGALRTGTAAFTAGSTAAKAAPVLSAAANGVRAATLDAALEGPRAAAPAATPAAPAATPVVPPTNAEGAYPDSVLNPDPNKITRVGNSYSGGPNIKFDGNGNGLGGGVSVINSDGGPTSAERVAQMERTAAHMKEMRLADQGLRDKGDANFYTTGAGANGGAGATGFSGATINDRRPGSSGSGLSAGFERHMAEMAAARQQQGQIAADRNRTELMAARGHDDTAMFGHGVAAQGHQLTAQVAQLNNERMQAIANRQYGFEKQKDDRAATESSQAADQKQIENQFQTKDDKGNSVPDRAKIADYQRAVTTTLPSLIKELQSGSPAEQAHAKKLQEQGPAALGPDGHDVLMHLYEQRERVQQAHGNFMPGTGTYRHSDNLLDFRQAPGAAGVQHNTLTPNKVVFRGGSVASPNDLRYADGPANNFLPDVGKIETNRYTRGVRTQ